MESVVDLVTDNCFDLMREAKKTNKKYEEVLADFLRKELTTDELGKPDVHFRTADLKHKDDIFDIFKNAIQINDDKLFYGYWTSITTEVCYIVYVTYDIDKLRIK